MSRTHVALGWMLVVLAGMSIPSTHLPVLHFSLADKFEHITAFFVLGLLWMHALGGSDRRRALVTLCIGLTFAVATEVYQGLMPIGRTADPLDALADSIGVALGIGMAFIWMSKKGRAKSNPAGFTVS